MQDFDAKVDVLKDGAKSDVSIILVTSLAQHQFTNYCTKQK